MTSATRATTAGSGSNDTGRPTELKPAEIQPSGSTRWPDVSDSKQGRSCQPGTPAAGSLVVSPSSDCCLEALQEIALSANRLAKQLAGSNQQTAYKIKAVAASALILAGAATINGTISEDIVGIDIRVGKRGCSARLHMRLSQLPSAARNIARRQRKLVSGKVSLKELLSSKPLSVSLEKVAGRTAGPVVTRVEQKPATDADHRHDAHTQSAFRPGMYPIDKRTATSESEADQVSMVPTYEAGAAQIQPFESAQTHTG